MSLASFTVTGLASAAPLFSIDGASPSVPGVTPEEVLSPGPLVVGTPCGFATGLGVPDELDALTCGVLDPGVLAFSVDRASLGAAGSAVLGEAGLGQAAADVYLSDLLGSNLLLTNQAAFGLVPLIAAGLPAPPPPPGIDNVDALDLVQDGFGPLFSVSSANSLGVSGADILAPGPGPLILAPGLGLVAADDIDALQAVPFGEATALLFSLAPGSPSLGADSPADIFISVPGSGAFALFATASDLGLLATDNVDALGAPIPEPSTLWLMALGLALLARRRR